MRRRGRSKRRWSASDFDAAVLSGAAGGDRRGTRSALRAAGLARDARIAVAIANSAQAARAIIAVTCSAAAVPIDPKLTVAEVERCLLILRPTAVLVLDQADPRRAPPPNSADFPSSRRPSRRA